VVSLYVYEKNYIDLQNLLLYFTELNHIAYIDFDQQVDLFLLMLIYFFIFFRSH